MMEAGKELEVVLVELVELHVRVVEAMETEVEDGRKCCV